MLITHASMLWAERKLALIPRRIRLQIMTICGVVLLVAPLLLWAAMSVGLFKIALYSWCTAFAIVAILVHTSPEDRF